MITIKKYSSTEQPIWDDFIDNSKNGTFMLKRGYMDYHSDRFIDNSLMFYEDDKLIALMPASKHGNELRSHGGLTYGGIITNKKMTAQKMLDIFDEMKKHLTECNITKLIYKCVPCIYHNYPADEDLYALFRNNAKLIRRDISTTIFLPEKIKFSDLRKRGAKKALKNGLLVKENHDFKTYIALLADVLKLHHDTKPVHTAEELELLASRFPDIIKLYAAFDEEEKMYAGVVIFDTPQTVHAQYIANSEKGREIGALDLVMDYLINTYAVDKKYFDFGISTEDSGRYLNNGLISQKEGFGGRATVYDFYEMEL